MFDKDPVLLKIQNEVDLEAIISTKSVFHDLMSCVVEQQIHYRSTKKIFQKLLEQSGLKILTTDNFEIFEEKGLAKIKLSGKKYETILAIYDFFKISKIDWFKCSEIEVKQHLSQITGIGPWTIDMILLYTLSFPDVFPMNDYHLNHMMTKLYTLNPKSRINAQIKEITSNWSPNKSRATQLILAYKKLKL